MNYFELIKLKIREIEQKRMQNRNDNIYTI
jgi:hypothetical protein